jgi:hypothetical protein
MLPYLAATRTADIDLFTLEFSRAAGRDRKGSLGGSIRWFDLVMKAF